MSADKYTAISAGVGALMGAKGMPASSALVSAVVIEAASQYAERRNPGITGGNGGSTFEKSALDIGALMLSFWLVRQANR